MSNIRLLGIVVLLTLFPAISQANISDCASQSECYTVLGNDNVLIYRKDVLKGTIENPNGSGPGKIIFSDRMIIWTRSSNATTRFYDITTGKECHINIVDSSCKAGPIIGNMNYSSCDLGVIKQIQIGICGEEEFVVMDDIDTTCTGPVSSLTSDGTLLYFLCSEDDNLGIVNPDDNTVTLFSIPTGVTEIGIANDILFYRTAEYLYYESLPFSGDATSLEVPNSGGSHLTVGESYACVDGGGNISCTNAYSPSSFSTEIVDGIITDISSDSRTQILSEKKVFLRTISRHLSLADIDVTLPETGFAITTIQPTKEAICGNGLVEPGETCDGTSFEWGNTCNVLLGNTSDTLVPCKSNCRMDLSVCDNFKVDTYIEFDLETLSADLMNLYEDNTQNLNHICEVSEDPHGNVEIIAPDGAYCNFATTDASGQTLTAHLYSNEALYGRASINVIGEIQFTSGGNFFINESNLGLKLREKVVGIFQPMTLAVPQKLHHEFVNLHPLEGIEGEWLLIQGIQGAIKYCPTNMDENRCGLYIADDETFILIINLNVDVDFSEFKEVDSPGDDPWWKCSTAAGSNQKNPVIFVLLIMLFGLAIRRKQHV
jgi:hypothetical protein